MVVDFEPASATTLGCSQSKRAALQELREKLLDVSRPVTGSDECVELRNQNLAQRAGGEPIKVDGLVQRGVADGERALIHAELADCAVGAHQRCRACDEGVEFVHRGSIAI